MPKKLYELYICRKTKRKNFEILSEIMSRYINSAHIYSTKT